MSGPGQTEKNSIRAHVFRFALKLGHCSTQSARLKRAITYRQPGRKKPAVKSGSPVGVFISLRLLARVVSRVDVVDACRPDILNLDDRLLVPCPSVMWVFCRVRIQ